MSAKLPRENASNRLDGMEGEGSPFLAIPRSQHVASYATMFAIRDRYPVNPGHTLIVPRREVASCLDLNENERREAWELVQEVCEALRQSHGAEGFNVGFNEGAVAGQTVWHAHIHVIPRYAGDMPDPRGGVRHVIPERGNYLLEREGGDP